MPTSRSTFTTDHFKQNRHLLKRKYQLYRWLCSNVRRKRNAKLDTTLSNCKWKKNNNHSKLMHYTHTTNKQLEFVHHVRFFSALYCFGKMNFSRKFSRDESTVSWLSNWIGIVWTTKQTQTKRNETNVNRKGSISTYYHCSCYMLLFCCITTKIMLKRLQIYDFFFSNFFNSLFIYLFIFLLLNFVCA